MSSAEPQIPLSAPSRRLWGFLLDVVLFVVTLGVGWIVWSVFEARASRTPGMRLAGEQIIDVHDAAPASGGRIAVRQALGIPLALLLGAVTCGVGWLFAAWLVVSPTRQGLWDRVAGTTVRDAP